jgi:transcriptional regulator with XRE-family HTH domain
MMGVNANRDSVTAMTDNHEPRSAIFARKVRQLREARDWSQAELGRRAGLGQSRTAAIEAAGSVTIDQAQAFADALQVPIEVLLYVDPPATKVVQLQRLLQIASAVDRLKDDVDRLVAQIGADLPGKLPPGTAITATEVTSLPPPLPESE